MSDLFSVIFFSVDGDWRAAVWLKHKIYPLKLTFHPWPHAVPAQNPQLLELGDYLSV